MKTAFIGHRQIFGDNVYKRVIAAVADEVRDGCTQFTMGTHGEFDRLALYACKYLRQTNPDIRIEVVITSLNAIGANKPNSKYSDIETVMYEIENTHFKQQITLSNRQMIDSCTTLICYVDTASTARSGARAAMNYAKAHGLKIVNLFK